MTAASVTFDDRLLPFALPAVARKKIVAAFDGGRLTSDGGVLLLAGAERHLQVATHLADAIADDRDRCPGTLQNATDRAGSGAWTTISARVRPTTTRSDPKAGIGRAFRARGRSSMMAAIQSPTATRARGCRCGKSAERRRPHAPHRRRGSRQVILFASAPRRRFLPRQTVQVAAEVPFVQDLRPRPAAPSTPRAAAPRWRRSSDRSPSAQWLMGPSFMAAASNLQVSSSAAA